MKKIGIVTFARANNYGALLQAYALKTALQKIGAHADVLNYLCPALEISYSANPFKKGRHFKSIIKRLAGLPLICFANSKFSSFKKNFLGLDADNLCNGGDMASLQDKYDLFITGSDQVFNIKLTGRDKKFFLDFVEDKNKKYSYAASFGNESFPQELEYTNLLKDFSALSVREASGVDYLKSLDIEARQDLDPTLLLNKTDWQNIAQLPNIKEDFIFFYSSYNNAHILNYVKKLSLKTSMPVYYSSGSYGFPPLKAKNLICSPESWLGHFIKAKYVVTNTFHGLAFSINLKKQFALDYLPSTHGGNIRIKELASFLNLEDRLIDNLGFNCQSPIDWESVEEKLSWKRTKSLDYLKTLCE